MPVHGRGRDRSVVTTPVDTDPTVGAGSGNWCGRRCDGGPLIHRSRQAVPREDTTGVVCNRLSGASDVIAVCVFSVCVRIFCIRFMLHYAGLPDRILHIGSGSPAYTTACTSISYPIKSRYQEFICPYRQPEIHPIMECLWVLAWR